MPVKTVSAGTGQPTRFSIYFPVLLVALGFLLFGYDTGVIAGAMLFIRPEMGLSPTEQGLVVSTLLGGAAVGAFFSGHLVERFGHRLLLIGAGALFAVGAAMAAGAMSLSMLVLARFILGLAVGVASAQVTGYIAEIAPTRIRGALAVVAPLMATTGIFVSYVVGYLLAGSGAWRAMFLVAIVPSLLLMGGVYFAPPSPRWLARRGRIVEARRVLSRINPPGEVEEILAGIDRVEDTPTPSLRAVLADRTLLRPLCLACGLAVLQQIVGINTIIYYAPTIFNSIGFAPENAILVTSFLQFLAILATLVTASVVDRLGRRTLLMYGAGAMAAALIAIGLVVGTSFSASTAGRFVAVVAVALYKMAFSFSWGPLVWVLMPEVLPQRARGTCLGAATLTNWISNLVVSFSFPILLSFGAFFVFGAFVGCCALAFLFALFALPETAGVALEALETQEARRPARMASSLH